MVDITQITSSRVGGQRRVPLILGRALRLFWPAADALVVVALAVAAGTAGAGFGCALARRPPSSISS